MKMDSTLLNRREIMEKAQAKMAELVESFVQKYHHTPAPDEIVFFCKRCHWWDDSSKDVFVKPTEKPHLLGTILTVEMCCPECFFELKAAHTKMFTEGMPDKIAAKKNGYVYRGVALLN